MTDRDALTAAEQRYHALLPHRNLAERIILALCDNRLKAAADYAQRIDTKQYASHTMLNAWIDRELAGAEAFLTAIELHREHQETRP
jgi:hypothetical protein